MTTVNHYMNFEQGAFDKAAPQEVSKSGLQEFKKIFVSDLNSLEQGIYLANPTSEVLTEQDDLVQELTTFFQIINSLLSYQDWPIDPNTTWEELRMSHLSNENIPVFIFDPKTYEWTYESGAYSPHDFLTTVFIDGNKKNISKTTQLLKPRLKENAGVTPAQTIDPDSVEKDWKQSRDEMNRSIRGAGHSPNPKNTSRPTRSFFRKNS